MQPFVLRIPFPQETPRRTWKGKESLVKSGSAQSLRAAQSSWCQPLDPREVADLEVTLGCPSSEITCHYIIDAVTIQALSKLGTYAQGLSSTFKQNKISSSNSIDALLMAVVHHPLLLWFPRHSYIPAILTCLHQHRLTCRLVSPNQTNSV